MYCLNLTPDPPKLAELILPELVWEKVLKFLTDADDIINSGKACTLFQRLIHTEIITGYLSKTFPVLTNYMDGMDILKCRLFCKGCRDVVDKFLEGNFLTSPNPKKILKEGVYPTKSSSELYRQRFMREMRNHPKNPFVGRAAHFSFFPSGDEEKDQNDFREVYDFFLIFGKHIWSLKLHIDENLNAFSAEIRDEYISPFIIKYLFELAPNLRNLCISGFLDLSITMDLEEIIQLPPPLALEHLDISRAFFENAGADNCILLRHSNAQLKTLRMKANELLNVPVCKLRNLKELHLEIDFDPDSYTTHFGAIRRKLNAPIVKVLSISMPDDVKANTFFRPLCKLCTAFPNLKTLRFSSSVWEKNDHFHSAGPSFKNVKTLKIPEENTGLADYSFLLRFPNIESIRIVPSADQIATDKLEGISEIVEVHKFMRCGRMYESNIWILLPKLQSFSYGKRTYTRSSYERREFYKICKRNCK